MGILEGYDASEGIVGVQHALMQSKQLGGSPGVELDIAPGTMTHS
jgi:hypothetical protein